MKSNIINQYFENVFVISTVENTGRQKYVMDYLNNLGVKYNLRIAPPKKFFEGRLCDDFVRGWDQNSYLCNGNISLKLCYASIFSECIYNNINKLLILEDDILFENDYETKFDNFMTHIPNDWDHLNIGYHEGKNLFGAWRFENINEYVALSETSYTTHAVAFRGADTLRRITDKIVTSNIPIDYVFVYFTHVLKCEGKQFMRSYIPNEIICRQQSYRSDCECVLPDAKPMFKSLIG